MLLVGFFRFVEWMKSFNEKQATKGNSVAAVYGLDMYCCAKSFDLVIDYLEKVDPEAGAAARKR